MPEIPASGATPAEIAAAPAQNAKTPRTASLPAGAYAPGYFKWLMLLAAIVLLVFRARLMYTYLKRRRRPAVEVVAPPEIQETGFHRCAHCGRTEITAPELDFRVARDGEEYCHAHLPKHPAKPLDEDPLRAAI